jgi:hypothetical protein
MSVRLIIRNVRIAFPAIFEPQAVGDGEPAYGAKFIVPTDHPQIDEIRKAVRDVAKGQWNDKADSVLKLLIADKKTAWVEGPYINKDGEPYEGFEDAFHLSSRSAKTRPTAFDNANNPATAADGLIYSGAYVDASVEVYAQDNKWGRRINCGLRGVRFVNHGQSFGGGAPAGADEFGAPVEVEDSFV